MTVYIWLCIAILAVLFYFDYWTTRNALKRPGNYEANPVMRKLFGFFGMEHALILVKLASICVIAWFAYAGYYESSIGVIALTALTALYAVIVVNNYRIYLNTK